MPLDRERLIAQRAGSGTVYPGPVAIDDPVELLDAPIELTVPAAGRYA